MKTGWLQKIMDETEKTVQTFPDWLTGREGEVLLLTDGTIVTLAPLLCMGNSPRSSKWSSFRKEIVRKSPQCAVCGGKLMLQVHHKKPFHLWPELELVEDNVCVLCEDNIKQCHLRIGHLGRWDYFNPLIDELIALYKKPPENKEDWE
jgi:hypothetical protein